MNTVVEEKTKEKKPAPLSRLGRRPVEIPQGVKVAIAGKTVTIEGKRGKLVWSLPDLIEGKVDGAQIKISPTQPGNQSKALHGLSRKLVLNMVEGVTTGFKKSLVIEGVGFRAQIAGAKLTRRFRIDKASANAINACAGCPAAIITSPIFSRATDRSRCHSAWFGSRAANP